MKEYIIGIALAACLFYAITHPNQIHRFTQSATESTAASASPDTTQPPATQSTTKPALPLKPAIVKDGPNQGMWVRGMKMPDGCQADKYPELVAYVTQHNDPNDKAWYVADKDVAGYVCGGA